VIELQINDKMNKVRVEEMEQEKPTPVEIKG
jgi:hypothetical protein